MVGSENNVFAVLWVVGVCSFDMVVESPGTSKMRGGGGCLPCLPVVSCIIHVC